MAILSIDVANKFIQSSRSNLTPMQLQKLVYIAHGWCLAITGNPLTIDSPEAWRYGPVYRTLWERLRKYGKDEVTEPIEYVNGSGCDSSLDNEEERIIKEVYDSYGNFDGLQLSALTHKKGTPWHNIYSEDKASSTISNESIKEHFIELAEKYSDQPNSAQSNSAQSNQDIAVSA